MMYTLVISKGNICEQPTNYKLHSQIVILSATSPATSDKNRFSSGLLQKKIYTCEEPTNYKLSIFHKLIIISEHYTAHKLT